MLFLHTFFNILIFLKKGEKKCEKLFLYYTSECYAYNHKAVVVAISTLIFFQENNIFSVGGNYVTGVWRVGVYCLYHTCVSTLLLQTSRSSIHHFYTTQYIIMHEMNFLLNINQMILLNINQKFLLDF